MTETLRKLKIMVVVKNYNSFELIELYILTPIFFSIDR